MYTTQEISLYGAVACMHACMHAKTTICDFDLHHQACTPVCFGTYVLFEFYSAFTARQIFLPLDLNNKQFFYANHVKVKKKTCLNGGRLVQACMAGSCTLDGRHPHTYTQILYKMTPTVQTVECAFRTLCRHVHHSHEKEKKLFRERKKKKKKRRRRSCQPAEPQFPIGYGACMYAWCSFPVQANRPYSIAVLISVVLPQVAVPAYRAGSFLFRSTIDEHELQLAVGCSSKCPVDAYIHAYSKEEACPVLNCTTYDLAACMHDTV